jgi:hypothetical protein
VQAEEEAEPSESEKQETLDPDPKQEPAKRKPPQVRPWDIGKEGVKEGKLVVYFLAVLLFYLITSYIYTDCVTYSFIHPQGQIYRYDEGPGEIKMWGPYQ